MYCSSLATISDRFSIHPTTGAIRDLHAQLCATSFPELCRQPRIKCKNLCCKQFHFRTLFTHCWSNIVALHRYPHSLPIGQTCTALHCFYLTQSHHPLQTQPATSTMASDNRFTLVLSIFGRMIALSALLIAFLQLRITRRVHMVYELA